MMLNSSSWFRPEQPVYSIGLCNLSCIDRSISRYFYTSITFNPLEVANNIKKQGGFIPGIRPGKPTSDYLEQYFKLYCFCRSLWPDHCQHRSDYCFWPL